jgi:hypothetical protein
VLPCEIPAGDLIIPAPVPVTGVGLGVTVVVPTDVENPVSEYAVAVIEVPLVTTLRAAAFALNETSLTTCDIVPEIDFNKRIPYEVLVHVWQLHEYVLQLLLTQELHVVTDV